MAKPRSRRARVVVLLLIVVGAAGWAVRRAMFAPPPARLLYRQGATLDDDSVREVDGGDGYVSIVAMDEASGTTVCVSSAWQVRLYEMLECPEWWEPTTWNYYAPPPRRRRDGPRWVEMRLEAQAKSRD